MAMEAIETCTKFINEPNNLEAELAEILCTNLKITEEIIIQNVDVINPNLENDSLQVKHKRRRKRRRRGKEEIITEGDKDNESSSSDKDSNRASNVSAGTKNKFSKDGNSRKSTKINEQIKINLSLIQSKEDYFEVPGEEIVGGLYTRVVIGGDAFLLDYSKLWPSSSNIKPYFLYKNKLSVDEVYSKFSDHHYLKNSEKILLLFVLCLHDFADYAIFLKASCIGNHLFTEYIQNGKNFNTIQCRKYIKKLMHIKENFEAKGNVTVSFSYFPELKNIRNLRTIFNSVPEDMPNCTCLCRNLGDLPGDLSGNHFANTMFNINRKISIKQLNCSKNKRIFEYMPPQVSFINGNWRLALPIEYSQNDVLLLNFLLKELIYDSDTVNISNEASEIKEPLHIMRTRIWRCKFRFILIGDTWIEFISRQWPLSSKLVPFFYFAENLTLTDICNTILSLVRKEEIGLVITSVPMGELFTIKTSSSLCKDHEPLEFPVPHESILKDPINYANQLITKINKFLKDTKNLRQHCGVVFTTCYPVKFASYYNYLSKLHSTSEGEKFHSESDSLIDIDFSEFDTKFNKCIEVINQYIVTSHKKHKLPLCNIYKVVNTFNEDITFPSYIEGKCPPTSIRKELFSCIKNYVGQFYDLCNARKLTFTQTEEYKRKHEGSKRRKENKKYHKSIMYERRKRTNNKEQNRGKNIVTGSSLGAELSVRMQRLNILGKSHQFSSPLISNAPRDDHSFNSRIGNLSVASGSKSSTSPLGHFSNSASSSSYIFDHEHFRHSANFNRNRFESSSFNIKDYNRLSYDPHDIKKGNFHRISSLQH